MSVFDLIAAAAQRVNRMLVEDARQIADLSADHVGVFALVCVVIFAFLLCLVSHPLFMIGSLAALYCAALLLGLKRLGD